MTRAALLVVLATVLAIAPADAANLIANGTFDVDLSQWDNLGTGKSWIADDAGGSPNSGAARILNSSGNGVGLYIFQCVPIVGGVSYAFGGDAKILTGATGNGRAAVALYFYSDPDCSVPLVFAGVSSTETVGTSYIPLASQAIAPANAASAELDVRLEKIEGGPFLLEAHFDDIYLTPEPDAFAAAVAALSSLGWLRKRATLR